MTVALDTSAWLARFLEGPTHAVVLDAMRADPDWCASALVLSESLMLLERLGDEGAVLEIERGQYRAGPGRRRPIVRREILREHVAVRGVLDAREVSMLACDELAVTDA